MFPFGLQVCREVYAVALNIVSINDDVTAKNTDT